LEPYELALGRLQNLGDPRAASLILRQCLSACKVSWVLRTAAPEVAVWAANKASPLLRHAWSTVVGCDTPDVNWRLASLPIREGGAGITDPVDLVEAALVSSWLSAATRPPATACAGHPSGMQDAIQALALKCPNLGKPLMAALSHNGIPAARQHELLPHWCTQGSWSDEGFKNSVKEFDNSVQERTKCVRILHTAPNAGLWLTSAPHADGGAPFAPEEWQLLLRLRTGLQLFPGNPICKACRQPMDPLGDHSLCCPASGMYRRHNRVRDTLFSLSQKAGWAPELEVAIPGTRDRPADILLRSGFPKPLAIDVTISHPLRVSAPVAARGEATSSAEAGEHAKQAAEANLCHLVGWGFRAAGFDTAGGMGPGALKTVRQLYRQLSMRQGRSSVSLADEVSRQLSLALAKGRGEMLAASSPE
jgi:hypothetical protein